jgi:hypothetical protein
VSRVQIIVEYADHEFRYFPVSESWRIDAAQRCLIIGRGLPREYVPLDSVRAFTIAELEAVPS